MYYREGKRLAGTPEACRPLKAAFHFLPKTHDGYNIPVKAFIRDCRLVQDSVHHKDRAHLFCMTRSRITR